MLTLNYLASFKLPVPLPCFCGAPVESLDHFFFYCPLAYSVLSWLQSLMFSFSFMCPALLLHHVHFGFSSDELCATPRVLVYLLNLCKFFIWQFRDDFRFRYVPPGAVDVIAKVKSRLKCHVPVLFKRFQSSRCPRYFHRRWGAVVSSLLLMVAICQSCYSPLSVVAVLVLFFVCVLPLGWLGVIIIVLFFVSRSFHPLAG